MRRIRRGLGVGARLATACVAAAASGACTDGDNNNGGGEASGSRYQVLADAVCEAAREARGGDADSARVVFFDDAHQPLHELAAQASEIDRAAAARLHEAKQAVESAFSDGDVEAAFSRLVPATDAALQTVDGPRVPCASEGLEP